MSDIYTEQTNKYVAEDHGYAVSSKTIIYLYTYVWLERIRRIPVNRKLVHSVLIGYIILSTRVLYNLLLFMLEYFLSNKYMYYYDYKYIILCIKL